MYPLGLPQSPSPRKMLIYFLFLWTWTCWTLFKQMTYNMCPLETDLGHITQGQFSRSIHVVTCINGLPLFLQGDDIPFCGQTFILFSQQLINGIRIVPWFDYEQCCQQHFYTLCVCVHKFFFRFWNGLLADLPFLLNWAFAKDFLCYIVKKAKKAIP